MPDEPLPQQQQNEFDRAVAKELIEGKKQDAIVKELVKNGLAADAAKLRVASTARMLPAFKNSVEGRRIVAENYQGRMLRGLAWTVAGIVVTVATYSAASAGGTYLICWGAILFGIIDFLVGLVGWLANAISIPGSTEASAPRLPPMQTAAPQASRAAAPSPQPVKTTAPQPQPQVASRAPCPQAWITARLLDGKEWKYPIDPRTPVYIGRGVGNQLNLAYDPVADMRHAVIYSEGNRFYVNNLSPKGTRINGFWITKQTLDDGNTIQIGNTVFVFRATG